MLLLMLKAISPLVIVSAVAMALLQTKKATPDQIKQAADKFEDWYGKFE